MSTLFNKKHQTIIEAAIPIFLENGFAGTSMDKVAQAATLSKATLYNHFKDKQELFQEVMAWHCQNLASSDSFENYLKKGSLEEKLESFARALVWALREPRSIALMRVVIFETGQFPGLGKAIWKDGKLPLLDGFCNFLKSEQDSGHLRIPNISIASRQFFGLIKENLVWPVLMGLDFEDSESHVDEVIKHSVEMFLKNYG